MVHYLAKDHRPTSQGCIAYPGKTANKYLYIAYFTVASNQVVVSFEEAIGEKLEVTHVDVKDQKKTGYEKLSKGNYSGGMHLVRYLSSVEGHSG